MIRITARPRALEPWLACVLLAALAACGGGGGSPSTATSGGGGATTESAYLLAEFVAADVNHQFVRVWDPAQPATAVQSVSIVQSSGIAWVASHLVFSDATRYDASSRTVTTLGHARVFFDNNGKLYTIDLRGGHSHAPVQLSSATDVFQPVQAYAMNAAGDDAWVDAQGSSHHWAVRTTMGVSDAPSSVMKVMAALRDATTGLPQYFFASLGSVSGTAVEPTTFELVDTAFARLDVPAIATMQGYDGLVGIDPAQPGLAYLCIANSLRALRWTASGASVDATSLRTLLTSLDGRPAVADAASLYFADQQSLLSVANGVVSTLGAFTRAPDQLVDAGAWIGAHEPDVTTTSSTDASIETIAKTGSHALTLIEPDTDGIVLLGAASPYLILAGTAEQGQAFQLASGDNTDRRSFGSQYVGLVYPAAAPLDRSAAPAALLSCVGATTGHCGAGALSQQAIGASTSIALGNLATSSAIVRYDATAGLVASLGGQTLLTAPGGLGSDEVDTRDAWQFQAGSAGSLVRVTSSLP